MSLVVGAVLLVVASAQAVNRIGVAHGPNGFVTGISQPDANGTRYLSGGFTAFNPWGTGNGALVGAESGAVDRTFPAVEGGPVWTAAPDGSGGFFIGGDFTTVGGIARNHAAHINGDGSLDAAWDPSPDRMVRTIAMTGQTVYLGGDFTLVGGATRNAAAAVGTDGTLKAWNPDVAGGSAHVNSIAVAGSTIFLGGDFTSVGTLPRNNAAAVDASGVGVPTAWDPGLTGGSAVVNDIAIAGSRVYLVGWFTAVGGVTRNHAAAVSTGGGLEAWDPNLDNSANAIAVSGSTAYLGGDFTTVGGAARGHLAAVSADGSGAVTAWNPQIASAPGDSSDVHEVAISETTVYVGGLFDEVSGAVRNDAAAIGTDGVLRSWNPIPNGQVLTIALSGSSAFVGGYLTAAGGTARNHVAAVDADGVLTAWNPKPNGPVLSLAIAGSTVYLGGQFTRIGDVQRNFAAAVGSDGTLGAWNPDLSTTNPNGDGSVCALVMDGSTVYLGGRFSHVGGVTRNYVAAIGAGGTLEAWNPNPNGAVLSLAVSGPTVYLGGLFNTVGTTPRSGIAAIATADGSVDQTWNPDAYWQYGAQVTGIVVAGSTVYVTGFFTSIGGQGRNGLAALGAAGMGDGTGAALPSWDPNPDGEVKAVAVVGSTVYIGGAFTHIGNASRSRAAAVGTNGVLLPWDPNPDMMIGAVAASDSTVFLGGWFSSVGGSPRYHAAAVDTAGNVQSPLWSWEQTSDGSPPPTDTSPSPAPDAQGSPAPQSAPPASAATAGDPAPLTTRRPSCVAARCSTSGSVPAGATQVVQIATRGAMRTGAASSRTSAEGRAVTRCRISSASAGRTYTCSLRLTAGTWLLTTLAKAGSVVIAESVRRVRVPAIQQHAPPSKRAA